MDCTEGRESQYRSLNALFWRKALKIPWKDKGRNEDVFWVPRN